MSLLNKLIGLFLLAGEVAVSLTSSTLVIKVVLFQKLSAIKDSSNVDLMIDMLLAAAVLRLPFALCDLGVLITISNFSWIEELIYALKNLMRYS